MSANCAGPERGVSWPECRMKRRMAIEKRKEIKFKKKRRREAEKYEEEGEGEESV